MTKRKIIIDTDPGQDDAVAILVALGSPDELDVLGITAVAGNVPLELTQKNARIVCELANRPDMLVFAGCDRCQLLVFVMNEIRRKDSRNFDTSSLSMCEISVPTTWRVPALWLRNQNQVAGF